MIPRHLEVVFCDDIRREIGNKVSHMGIYAADLRISEIPAVLPKLCISIHLITPREEPFEKAIIKVSFEDQILMELADLGLSEGFAKAQAIPAPEGTDFTPPPIIELKAVVTLSPFGVDRAGILRVTVETETGVLRAKGLWIHRDQEALA